MADATASTVTGVERALDVLLLFGNASGHDRGVTEVAETLGLSKAVVHRILSSLRAKGFVELDPVSRRYRLGPRILTLGLTYLERLDVHALAREALRELVHRTDETATMSLRVGWTRVYVDQVVPTRDVKMVVQLATPYPLHTGASSKALLAFLPADVQDEYLALGRLEKLTAHTTTSPTKLRRELREIRDRGYAVSFGERQDGAGAVAAPVFDHGGAIAAVLSVCGPVERFRSVADRCATVLLEETGRTSARLGHRAA